MISFVTHFMVRRQPLRVRPSVLMWPSTFGPNSNQRSTIAAVSSPASITSPSPPLRNKQPVRVLHILRRRLHIDAHANHTSNDSNRIIPCSVELLLGFPPHSGKHCADDSPASHRRSEELCNSLRCLSTGLTYVVNVFGWCRSGPFHISSMHNCSEKIKRHLCLCLCLPLPKTENSTEGRFVHSKLGLAFEFQSP